LAFWGVLWAVMMPMGVLAGVIGYDRVDVWFGQFEILAVPLIVAFLVGSATPGYVVGRAGLGPGGKLLAVARLMTPFAVMWVWAVGTIVLTSAGLGPQPRHDIQLMAVTMTVGVPLYGLIFLVPTEIGYRRGRRAEHRAPELVPVAA
jgi:hypothetical protein